MPIDIIYQLKCLLISKYSILYNSIDFKITCLQVDFQQEYFALLSPHARLYVHVRTSY